MMVEDYVPFEVSKLLKEKGFDAEIHMYWCAYTARSEEGYIERCPEDLEVNNNCSLGFRPDDFECIAPTLQMALKWLREVHGLYIEFVLNQDVQDVYLVLKNYYHFNVSRIDRCANEGGDCKFYNSYEEACEAAIKYCLENLI